MAQVANTVKGEPEPSPPSLDASEAQRKALQEDLDNRETMINSLQTTIREMKRELNVTQADVESLAEEKDALQEELDELRKRKPDECNVCPQLQSKVDALTEESNQLHTRIEAMEAEAQPLKRSIATKDQTIQEMTARLAEMERHVANDKSEYEKAVSERDRSIDALQQKLRDLKREMNVVTDDYESVHEEKQELEQKLDEVETQLVNVEDELTQANSLIEELRAEIELLKNRNEQLLMTQEEDREKAAAAESALRKEHAEALSAVERDLKASREAEAAHNDTIRTLQATIEQLKQTQSALNIQVTSLTDEKAALETAHLEEASKLRADKEMWETKYNELNRQLGDRDATSAQHVRELTARREEQVAKLEELESNHADVVAKHEEKSVVEKELRAALAAITTEKALWAEKIKQLETRQAEQDKQLKQQVADLTMRWEFEVANTQKVTAQHQASQVKYEEEKAALQAEIAKASKQRTKQDKDWAKQEKNWKQEVAEITSRWQDVNMKLQKLQSTHDTVVSEKQSLSDEVDQHAKNKYWNPLIHVACLFAGIVFGMKVYGHD
ncbi:hypothetical protein LEN26_019953 [Aphanomyces euteiches]|nr:hypothetical protein LEN26_019953 [Aphanomyces euteiches]KAH9112544.1 hypothetical protein AeMF1_013129 [Aphanomyces euteiches]KAH9190831.1 hypothetical protein AeNC1_007198 [Aphanomyces euteiches]